MKRKVVIAQVRQPVQRTVAVWTVYALDSEDEQEMKDQPQNLEETEAEVSELDIEETKNDEKDKGIAEEKTKKEGKDEENTEEKAKAEEKASQEAVEQDTSTMEKTIITETVRNTPTQYRPSDRVQAVLETEDSQISRSAQYGSNPGP